MKSPRFFSVAPRLLCLLATLAVLNPAAFAALIYTVTVNTTALSGQSGYLAFDLIGGDAAVANNTVNITGLTSDGTLALPGVGAAITDNGFFNEHLRSIVFGTTLTYTLQSTNNATGPGVDQFSFFLLNPSLFALGNSTDPAGAGALFAIDLTGTGNGNLAVFGTGLGGLSWTVTQSESAPGVPDQGSTVALLGTALLATALVRRRFLAL